MTPSEPVATDELFHGYRAFERVRRPTVGGRRGSPADNSFVAIDRVIGRGHVGLLLRRAHPCTATTTIVDDLRDPALRRVGLELVDTLEDHDGHLNAVLTGCPGVRLRAVAEKCAELDVSISPALAWHLVRDTARLLEDWRRAKLEAPGDTFVGFDGRLHLFPRLPACARAECPSYVGNEVWDSFIVTDDPESLAQLLTGSLPRPFMTTPRPALPPPEPVARLLSAPRTSTDATANLADLVRTLFPGSWERQRRLW